MSDSTFRSYSSLKCSNLELAAFERQFHGWIGMTKINLLFIYRQVDPVSILCGSKSISPSKFPSEMGKVRERVYLVRKRFWKVVSNFKNNFRKRPTDVWRVNEKREEWKIIVRVRRRLSSWFSPRKTHRHAFQRPRTFDKSNRARYSGLNYCQHAVVALLHR